MFFVSIFHQRASTGVSVPRETGEPKGVEGVLARDAAKAAMTQ